MRKVQIYLGIIAIAFCLTMTLPAGAVDQDGQFILVIDPGHGGKDPGAVNGKNQEKAINLNVALKLGKLIEDNCKDVKVIYTRKTDVFVELYKRADIANKAGADMFISIHTNSAKNKSANGAETYLLGVEENRTSANLNAALEENKAILLENDYQTHYEGYDPNSPESMIIFEFMQNEYQKESLKMASFTQDQMISSAKRPDRGVHQAGYLVLWKSTMPSILCSFNFSSVISKVRPQNSWLPRVAITGISEKMNVRSVAESRRTCWGQTVSPVTTTASGETSTTVAAICARNGDRCCRSTASTTAS